MNKKEKMFAYVAGFVAEHGYGPTTREIMEAVGLKSTSGVDYWMNKLEEEGRLVRERDERGRARVGRMTISGIIGDVAGERHDRSLPAGTEYPCQDYLQEGE